MKVYIYDNGDWLFRYTIMIGRPWPNGSIATVAVTKWGSRRVARRIRRDYKRIRETPPLVALYDNKESS